MFQTLLDACGTATNNNRSSPHDATKTSYPLNTNYSNLTTGYKYPKPLNTKYSNLTAGCKYPKTQYDYDAWTYKKRLNNEKSPHIYSKTTM